MTTTDELKFIKRPGKKVRYSTKHLDELRGCMHPTDGPRYFMENFLWIQHPIRGKIKIQLYEYQKELINCYHENRYSIALVGRQLGKTTIASGYLLWYAMFIPDSYVLIASKSGEDAVEIMAKVRYAYEELPDYIRAGVREYNKKSLLFDNGSRIVSTTTTENTGRGRSISLIYLDEFAFVDPPRVATELWTSLSPTLSTGGKCIITSTPNSLEDQFAQIWFDAIKTTDEYGNEREDGLGVNNFKSFFCTWKANPERDEEWVRGERGKIGEARFQREHECEFIVFDETLINSVKLSTIEAIDPIKISGQVRWYKRVDPNMTYVVSLDPSMGTGGDNAAIQAWELPSMTQVAEWSHNRTPIEGQMRVFKDILRVIQNDGATDIYWSIETNSLGEAALVVVRDTGEENFPGVFLHEPNKGPTRVRRKGFITTHKSKLEACARLKEWVESDKLKVSSKMFLSELRNFVARGSGYEARSGTGDDVVSACLLFIRMATFIGTWDDITYSRINSDIGDYDDYELPMPMLVM